MSSAPTAPNKRRGKRRGTRYSLKVLRTDARAPAPGPGEDLPLLRLMSPRPTWRGACADGPRPCPFVSCQHHLALDVSREGALRFPHGHEPEDLRRMAQTCALDVADNGGHSVAEVAELMGISRQRTAQLEIEALRKLTGAFKLQSSPALLREIPALRKRFAESGGVGLST